MTVRTPGLPVSVQESMVRFAGDPGAKDWPDRPSARQNGSSYTSAILKHAPSGIRLVQERSIHGKHRLVDDLAGDGDRTATTTRRARTTMVVGADDDALVVLGDAAHRLRQMDRVAELDGDRPVDGTHAATGRASSAASLTPSTKLGPPADAIW